MKLIRVILVAIVLAFAICGVASSQPQLTHTPNIGIRVKSLDEKYLVALFEGEIWISGTLEVTWPEGDYQRTEKNSKVELKSKSAVFKKFPHFSGYPIKAIELENGYQLLEQTVGSQVAGRFVRGEINAIKVKGNFLITQVTVGVECDAPWARASLVKSKGIENVVVSMRRGTHGCG